MKPLVASLPSAQCRHRWLTIITLFFALSTVDVAWAFRPQGPQEANAPDIDHRRLQPPVAADKERHRLAEEALRTRLPRLKVHRHSVIGSPAWVVSEDSWLSGTNGVGGGISRMARDRFASEDPHAPVKAFLHEHASLFGHDASAIEVGRAHIAHDYVTRHNGLRTTVWQQEHSGIPIFQARLLAHSTSKGELVNIASQFVADPAASEKAGMTKPMDPMATPITPAQAISLAMGSLGNSTDLEAIQPLSEAAGKARVQTFTAPGADGAVDVRLVWMPVTGDSMRLCWEVELTIQAGGTMYRLAIDAETGEVWTRHCLTNYLSNASYRVITAGESPTPRLPGYPHPGSNAQPATVARTVVTFSALDTSASPDGWIHDGDNSTLGNNVDAHLDLDDNNVADLPRPQGSPSRVFDFPLNVSFAPSSYRNAAVVNLFYWCNWMHDKLYELGFTEAAGNFQKDNFGKGGVGNDAVQADAQDGGGFNNANFGVGSDGKVPRMQMYVYDGATPDRDGDLDLTVVLHEYTHGLSQRLVGGGVGMTAQQSGAMGEGWSDFYSLALLAPANASLAGSYPHGAYSIKDFTEWGSFANSGDNYYFGTRRYPYCTDMQVNPLTFKDIDPNQIAGHPSIPKNPLFAGSNAGEVHNAGEVWCMALWEVRAKLIAKLGYNVGNQLALQIVTDGMKLSPANPNFVQARDAIFQAEQLDSGGANKNELWAAFAKRGLGEDAVGGNAGSTVGVVESFGLPDTLKVFPLATPVVRGPAGGSFNFTSTNYVVSNATASVLTWAATTVAPLSLSPASGSLAAHSAATVKVTVNTAQIPVALTNIETFLVFSNRVTHVTHPRELDISTWEPLTLKLPDSISRLDIFYGPQGGPFESIFADFSEPYKISNASAAAMKWSVAAMPYLKVTPNSGTLAANSEIILTPSPTLLTQSLPIGDYTNAFVVSNLTTSSSLPEGTIEFHVRNDNYLTKLYDGGAMDIQNTTLSFVPNNSPRGYQVCRQSAGGFPTDPTGGTTLHHDNYSFDKSKEVVLGSGKHVSLYGKTSTHVWVNFGGSLSLDGPADASGYNILDQHFGNLQVAGIFDDYYDGYAIDAGATISWKQLPDRFAATWQKMVNGYAGKQTNSFQIELFFSGAVRVTLLGAFGDFSVVGLSHGTNRPPDFIDTDFAKAPTCDSILPDLHVSVPSLLKEASIGRPTIGHVTVDAPVAANLVVALSSSDTTEVTVPASVVILAGTTNANFSVGVVDDAILDGTQGAVIKATASFYNPGYGIVFVNDNETTTLHIEMPALLVENSGYVAGRVYTTVPVGDDVDISFQTSPPAALGFSGFWTYATIPAGQTSAVFHVQAFDNRRLEGPVKASVIASVANWTSATNELLILDDETTKLTVIAPLFVGEGAGLLPNACEVRLTGTVPTNVVVAFTANLGFEYIPIGPITIPAGQTNAFFNLFVGDNAVIDGIRIATLTATAPGFLTGQGGSFVIDNDGPPDPLNPYPPDLSDDIPTHISLSWDPVDGELIVNGDFETGDLSGWSRTDTGAGGYLVDGGTFDPPSPDGAQPPFAGSFSALTSQFGNGHHELWQDIAIPSGATTVTLTWADRIHNHAGLFATNSQQFRVEVRDPADNQVLTTLYASKPGDPLLSGWIQRTNSLGLYKGKTVRVAFVEDDQLGYLNVGLDSVHVVAGAAAPTSFDVYFGTNEIPVAADYAGSTTQSSFALPLLAAGTDYHWRVDVKRAGITNAGPVWSFRTAGVSSNATLVAFGSSWKYNAHGNDLGTAWRAAAYSDAGWSTGVGTLGFGGKQDTIIGVAANGYTTFYFRKKIVLNNVDRISDLTARLIRDDGAVVYINGQRAFTSNMPGRVTPTYTTEAATEVTGIAEAFPVSASLNPTLLVEGTNVIAVEVHQFHPGLSLSPDLLFDLELKANVNVGNDAPAITLTGPSNPITTTSPSAINLTASVTDDDPSGLQVDFLANGVLIGSDSVAPYQMVWNADVPGDYTLVAVARDNGGLTTTSAPIRALVLPQKGSVFTWIPSGSVWSYNDSGADLGTDWVAPHYGQRGWKHGPAQLGYGDGDEATELKKGPSPFQNYVTYYFRRTFTNTIQATSLLLRVLRDDGVAVYLNGEEIWRDNLPQGPLSFSTLAVSNITGAAENAFNSVVLPVGKLTRGVNVLAVEVHQVSIHSGDLSFDLELSGIGTTPPSVTLTQPLSGDVFHTPTNVSLSATASSAYANVLGVDFFSDGLLLGSSGGPLFQTVWPNPVGGDHVLSAVVTDSQGATQASNPVAISVFNPATLQIQQVGAQTQLVWPLSVGNYALECATNLTPPVTWMTVTNASQNVNGQIIVPVDSLDPQRYFRLRGP